MYPSDMDDLKSPAHFETVPLNHPSTPLSQHHLRTHQQAQQQQQQPHQTPRRHRRDPSYDQHDDDEDDYDDSITDVESEHDRHIRLSLVEEGDYLNSRPMRPRSRRSRGGSGGGGVLATIKEHRWLIDTGLLVMIMFLLLFRPQRGRDHFWEGAGDLTGFAPEFSQKIVTFTPDPGFVPENATEFFTDETHDKWLGLVPPGLGYVNVVDPSTYDNLPAKLTGYDDDEYVATTAVTHQLHCLHAIAKVYSTLRLPQDHPKYVAMTEYETWHVGHCFDYLRQSLMCCGDVALEGQQTTFPGDPKQSGSDGFDAKHVCKDYGEVFEHLKVSAVNRDHWI